MKKLLIAACLTASMAMAANAADEENKEAVKPKHEMTADQKAVSKELVAKYDTNKNGRLDKEERAKMSAEDKTKWEKAFPVHHKTDKETK